MKIELVADAEASAEVREIFEDIRRTRGAAGLTSTWRFFAHDADLLRHWWGLTKRLESGTGEVSEDLLHAVAVVCAAEVGCPRCFSSHQAALMDRFEIDLELAQSLPVFEDTDVVPAHWKPVLRLARKVAFAEDLTAEDVEAVRALGYSDSGLVELVSVALLESSLARRSRAMLAFEGGPRWEPVA